MIHFIVVLAITSLISANTPLEQTQHFKVYKLPEFERQHISSTTYGPWNWTDITEYPYDGIIPPDSGGNFGDWEFQNTLKNGTLVARDTIINSRSDEDLMILYERQVPRYVEDFKLFNFGRQRGLVQYALIWHPGGFVTGEILVAKGNVVRLFAEVYAREL